MLLLAMIVCSCNVFTDRDVRTISAREFPHTTGQVYQRLGCNAQCGRCVRTIRRIMDEALATAERDQIELHSRSCDS
jgi:bacterioferritin-associated ferredoxin